MDRVSVDTVGRRYGDRHSADISTDTRPMRRPRLGRHIGRHQPISMSADTQQQQHLFIPQKKKIKDKVIHYFTYTLIHYFTDTSPPLGRHSAATRPPLGRYLRWLTTVFPGLSSARYDSLSHVSVCRAYKNDASNLKDYQKPLQHLKGVKSLWYM